ncbi:hypothetical protein LPJ74_000825 [Coemansia sp. RSA 1843]|nr:hypothetical protein LPJ74_000825 [Coemansia sp. RSA 1843]
MRHEATDQSEAETSEIHPVPVVLPCRRYCGHCNFHTIKDVSFVLNKYVASGSDDGNMFIWDTESMELVSIIHGDNEVVNIIEGHPFLPIIAVSGIDCEVQIFHLSQGGPALSHRHNFPLLRPFHFAAANITNSTVKDAFTDLVYSRDPYVQDLDHSGHLLVSPKQHLDEIRSHILYSYPAVSTNKIEEKAQIMSHNEDMRLDGLVQASLSSHIMNRILLGGLVSVQGDSSDTSVDDDESDSAESSISGLGQIDQYTDRRIQHYPLQTSSLSESESNEESASSSNNIYEF